MLSFPVRCRDASRRRFLRSAAGSALFLASGLSGCVRSPFRASIGHELLEGDALDQAARVRRGDTTPTELVLAAIDRIEALNPPLNAVVSTFYERALREARGPLPNGPFRGVPYLLKDLIDLEGTPKTMGSRSFQGFVSKETAPHARAALEGGLIVLGKTNTPEFGLVATTEPAALGICRNPWNRDRSAGGSSGGAAAAVASGMLPIAQASDGGGSIRVPASCCGVLGLKPSRGRNRAGRQTRAVDISVKHCVSRSVRDTAAYSVLVQRRDETAPYAPLPFIEGPSGERLRIGFFTVNPYGDDADPEVKRSIEATAALCADLGHEVEPVDLDFEGEAFLEHFMNLWSSVPAGIVQRVQARGLAPESVLEPVTLGLAERFSRAPDDAVPRAAAFFEAYARRIDLYFRQHDMLLSPVLRRPPIPIGEQAGTKPFDQVYGPMIDYVSYTPIWNATGHPAMSVPMGWSDEGLPIGSQFIAGYGHERRLIEMAYALEAARPWTFPRSGHLPDLG